ncbi:cobyrinate a,c-diamide synthase [Selenomonas sp. GACV-9]|uniref:cobyrinate a,c-diamide synthase n=1 Tax=Selenomonas sp. GACV-9 TaxID=3158782 RepID=UPI00094D5AE6
MKMSRPRLVIAATQSGSGKTTIVTGLLAALCERGLTVQSFKVGPDYIDPGYHALASGRPAHNLDTWLTPEQLVPALFAAESEGVDLAVVEGVMGLYDGGRRGVSSTAAIAKLLDAPVLLVIDAKSMGASAAAIAQGFRDYDPSVRLAGVILNRLGSETHEVMIREAMEAIGIKVYGAMRRNDELKMPERHLGLLPVQENEERQVVQKMGQTIGRQLDIEAIMALARQAGPLMVEEMAAVSPVGRCRIGVARDEAFSFYYPSSLQVLERLGAELVPFSPLHDEKLPDVDGLLIGGGFPEIFAQDLAANTAMRTAIRQQAEAGMPIYAECGGYMYLMAGLQDFAGSRYPMAGVFAGDAVMTKKLQMVGYVTAKLKCDTILGEKGMAIQGHEFHFSLEQDAKRPLRPFDFTKLRNGVVYDAGQQYKQALGSYLHLHFAGCPTAAESFVRHCVKWRRR